MDHLSLPSMTVLQYLAHIHQLSYTQVCKEVGLTPQQFNDWVKKRRPIPKDRLQQLAAYFLVDQELLIDDQHYLSDLTSENSVDVQIFFMQQKLENGGIEEEETYQLKLAQLRQEKHKRALVARFAAIIQQGDEETLQRSEEWLNKAESLKKGATSFSHRED
ncbi:MAG: helix-turn-helix transcriptional regulator [Paenibacillus sp.]|uniref:XRE family transcriptional regulator n=1 Tax=Paenibacillus sp. TaxID=58172 RepID=UPI002601237A|nr:XRE family transcriptional regulator [Paenibacillus sp.]MBR2565264.1 helix-turn-helix transcriptional regulator [Paenibacillus sp.]